MLSRSFALQTALVVCMFLSIFACVSLPSTDVYAQDTTVKPERFRVAVLNVIGEGVDGNLAREITQVIKAQTRHNPRFRLVQQEDIALLESLLLFGCDEASPDCMHQLAESLNADRLIYGRLRAVDGLYDIEVEIFDDRTRKVAETWNKRFTANADVIGFFQQEMKTFLGGRKVFKPITLRVSSNMDQALVRINGKRAGRTPFVSSEETPGTVTIQVSKEGHNPWSKKVTLKEGGQFNYKATLTPLDGSKIVATGPDKKDPDPKPSSNGIGLQTTGWILSSLGGASLLGGGIFGVLSLSTKAEFDDTPYYQEANDLKDRGELQASAANALFIGGGVTLAIGVALLALDAMDDSPPPSARRDSKPSEDSETTISPLLSPTGAGFQVSW